jgi:hypothetical protein
MQGKEWCVKMEVEPVLTLPPVKDHRSHKKRENGKDSLLVPREETLF